MSEEMKKTVVGDLHSFLYEIARFSKTLGPHYRVHGYPRVIEHHNGRWTVFVESIVSKITVKTASGDVLVVDEDNKMYLNGELVKELCAPGYRCFAAEEIRKRVAVASLLWEFWELRISNEEELAKFAEALLGEPP
jgi:hypothetical protein